MGSLLARRDFMSQYHVLTKWFAEYFMGEVLSQWIAAIPPNTLAVVPLVAFLESCVVVGLFVSGIFLLTIVTLIYAQGDVGLPVLVSLAFVGAFIGDQLGFYIGRGGAPFLWQSRWVRKQLLKRKLAYRKYRRLLLTATPIAICIGRLSPPIRSISPVVAGLIGLRPFTFLMCDIFACAVWAAGLAILAYGANQI
jgi:membrane-associated protein